MHCSGEQVISMTVSDNIKDGKRSEKTKDGKLEKQVHSKAKLGRLGRFYRCIQIPLRGSGKREAGPCRIIKRPGD